jgi:hypothetical protein
MKTIPALFLAAFALSLPSCNTTGDPTEGGLFGWSQSKFDERIYQKERTLHSIEQDTYQQNRRADSLRSDIRDEQGNLRRYE